MEALTTHTTKEDQKKASQLLDQISTLMKTATEKPSTESVPINIFSIIPKEKPESITLPRKVLELLLDILARMAEGKSLLLIPADSEVSTQQAADLLNVSRPHLVKLLEQGSIPFKKVGSHRRILLEDILAYEQQLKAVRREKLASLAQQAQELNLGYE